MKLPSRTTLVVVVLVLVLFFFGTKQVVHIVKNGSRVGPAAPENAAGLVPVAPAELLRQTNVQLAAAGKPTLTIDEYALARALQSEHGGSSAEVRTWVAWAIRNAAGGPTKIFAKLTTSKNPKTTGYFARQITDARYAATNQTPYSSNVEIARAVCRAPASADPTRAATNFFSPRLQDSLYAKALAGDPKYAGRIKSDAAGIRRSWTEKGLVSRGAPATASAGEVEFFGKKIA